MATKKAATKQNAGALTGFMANPVPQEFYALKDYHAMLVHAKDVGAGHQGLDEALQKNLVRLETLAEGMVPSGLKKSEE